MKNDQRNARLAIVETPDAHGGAQVSADLRECMRSQRIVPGRVSVIVPVYQGERYIVGAVRSALRQTYTNLEVLVVDDGSTDGTVSRLAGLEDPRLRVLAQANQGTGAARDLALAQACGEYIAFLDADDRWFPRKIETEVRTLQSSPSPIAIVYSWYYAVDDDGRLLNRSRPCTLAGNVFETILRSATEIGFLLPSVTLFHRQIFEEIGGFDAGESLHEDAVLLFKATKRFPVYPTRTYQVVYRQTVEGKCRNVLNDFEKACDAAFSIAEDLQPYLSSEQSGALREHQNRALYFRFLMYGFGKSATRMLATIDRGALRHGLKGWIAWLHSQTGINLMLPLRLTIQGAYRAFGQRGWKEELLRQGLDLSYGSERSRASTIE